MTKLNICFDGLGAQGILHNKHLTMNNPEPRLKAACDILQKQEHSPKVLAKANLNSTILQECDIFITTSRALNNPYNKKEISLLKDFVKVSGKSLLILANHGKNNGIPDLCTEEAKLADQFEIKLIPDYLDRTHVEARQIIPKDCQFSNGNTRSCNLIKMMPCGGCNVTPVVNNCSYIDLPNSNCTPVSLIPIQQEIGSVDDYAFAVFKQIGKGKVIVVGDSGFIGNPIVPPRKIVTGPGLFDINDNIDFFLWCINFLA